MFKDVFFRFLPKKNTNRDDEMVDCFPLMNIEPKQADFGTAFLCKQLNVSNSDTFFDIRDLVIRYNLGVISEVDFFFKQILTS